MFDELWSEIADAPGEIFDEIEYKEEWEKEEKFNVENYLNSNYDYCALSSLYSGRSPCASFRTVHHFPQSVP